MANARTALLTTKGTSVWVPDAAQSWVTGTVEDVAGKLIVVALSSGEKVQVDPGQVELYSMSATTACKVEDLTKLPNLHEPNLLLTLHERFKLGDIYTYTGPILLALNPFKKLPALYSDANLKRYLTADIGHELPPHAWRIADRAYKNMAADGGKNQSVLVSGESGAGKTETTKIVMKYLTLISQSSAAGGGQVADRVLQVNPLIEAFGNAKTSRNDNSSRFGKLIQMRFDPLNGKLLGAHVDTWVAAARAVDAPRWQAGRLAGWLAGWRTDGFPARAGTCWRRPACPIRPRASATTTSSTSCRPRPALPTRPGGA
jgi:myosin-5